jgi:periplasmic nitrate reductase NapD
MPRDRRQFIRGRWVPQTAKLPSPGGTAEIASILVQTRPERLAAAEAAIGALAGAEIFGRDARGKLVVVVEAVGSEPIGEMLTRISLLPDVVTATLVYHAIDADAARSNEDKPS